MHKKPLVSLIIVTHNRQNYLRECINSIVAQSYKNIETVVIDNASTDQSVEMVEKDFPSIELIKLDRNLGCPGGRNIGILNTKGEYIFFLDDDCVLAVDAIERALVHFTGEKKPDIVAPAIIESGRSYSTPGDPEGKVERYLPVFTGVSAIKRSVFHNNGLYPTDFSYGGEETDLSLRLLSNHGRILYGPDVIVFHYPAGNRNQSWELQSRLLNGLQTLWKYAPLSRALYGTIAKPLQFLILSLQIKAFTGWFRAIPRIPLMIFRTIYSQRASLGWYPFMLSEFLMVNIVTSWDQVSDVKFPSSWLLARFNYLNIQSKEEKKHIRSNAGSKIN